jgi:hypothetical protein
VAVEQYTFTHKYDEERRKKAYGKDAGCERNGKENKIRDG